MRKNIILLFIARAIKIVVGVLTLSLSAKYFGISIDRDLWILALNFVTVLETALWGPLNETFRVKFIFIKDSESEKSALEATNSLLALILLVSIVFVVILIVFRSSLANMIAPTFGHNELFRLSQMMLIVAPCFLITQITQIGASILNAYNVFFIPEIAGFVSSIVSLALLILLAPVMGVYSLAVSYYLALFILIGITIRQISKIGIPLKFRFYHFNFKKAFPFILFSLPFFFPYFIGQVNSIFEKTLAGSLGAGSISIIDYSRKFTDIIMSVVNSVLTTMFVPVIASAYAQRNWDTFRSEFLKVFQLSMIFFTVIVSVLTASANSLVNLLFNKGTISFDGLQTIANMVRFYTVSLIPIILYVFFGLSLLSCQESKKYAIVGIVAQISGLLMNLFLIRYWGLKTFPISLTISHFLVSLFLIANFPKDADRSFVQKSVGKYIGIMILTIVFVNIMSNIYTRDMLSIVQILIVGAVSVLSVFVQLYLFRTDEFKLIIDLVSKWKK